MVAESLPQSLPIHSVKLRGKITTLRTPFGQTKCSRCINNDVCRQQKFFQTSTLSEPMLFFRLADLSRLLTLASLTK